MNQNWRYLIIVEVDCLLYIFLLLQMFKMFHDKKFLNPLLPPGKLPGSDDFTEEFNQTCSEGDNILYKLVLKEDERSIPNSLFTK